MTSPRTGRQTPIKTRTSPRIWRIQSQNSSPMTRREYCLQPHECGCLIRDPWVRLQGLQRSGEACHRRPDLWKWKTTGSPFPRKEHGTRKSRTSSGPKKESTFWQSQEHAVEVSLALPDTKKKFEQFIRDPSQFFIKSLKRKTVEVSERRMTPQERENFRGAKSVEVQKFIAAKAMEVLPPELKPDRSQALRMRWILTYKQQDDGGLKPKVRAVLLGFQDPEYANRPTFAPTMTRSSRQLLLQYCAWQKMTCWKGDVSGRFFKGENISATSPACRSQNCVREWDWPLDQCAA